MRPRRPSRGFTLIEILLSTALLTVLLAALFSAHHTAHRALRSGRERFELIRRAMLAVTRLRRILASASPYGQRNPKADFAGEGDRLIFVSLARDAELGVAPVNYVLAAEEGRVFLRRDPLAPFRKSWDEKTFETVELAGLVDLELAYGDGTTWHDTWKLGSRGELPAVIRLRLTLRGEGEDSTLELEELVRIEGARRKTQR